MPGLHTVSEMPGLYYGVGDVGITFIFTGPTVCVCVCVCACSFAGCAKHRFHVGTRECDARQQAASHWCTRCNAAHRLVGEAIVLTTLARIDYTCTGCDYAQGTTRQCPWQISWGTFRGSFYVRTFDAHNAPRSPLATKGKKSKKKNRACGADKKKSSII